jgi:acyl carrier protein
MDDNGMVRRSADPTTEGEVARAVRATVAEKLQRAVSEVPWDADLESELGVDSLVMIEINVLLEERFHFAMPEVTAPSELQVRTVRDLAAFVAARLAERPATRGV